MGKKSKNKDSLESASIPMGGGEKEKPNYSGSPGPVPVSQRKCRDVFWAILLVLYWVGMFVIAGFAIDQGKPFVLTYGVDSEGNFCGQENGSRNLTGLDYLLFFNLTSPSDGYQKCVAACPSEYKNFDQDFFPITNDPSEAICMYDYPLPNDTATLYEAVRNGSCVPYVLSSSPTIGRCVPELLEEFLNQTTVQVITKEFTRMINERGFSLDFYRDLYSARYVILMSAGIAALLSFVWLILLQICGGFMVFLSLLLVCASLGGACAYLWYNWYQIKIGGELVTGGELDLLKQYGMDTYFYTEQTFLVCAIVVSVFTLLFYLALIFLRERIMLAVTVTRIASRAVRKVPSLVIFPFLKFLMLIGVTAWFVYIMINLATAGTVTEVDLYYYTFQSNYVLEYLQIYYVFGYFWTWNMITAIGDTAIAGAIAVWYWTMDKKKIPFFVVGPALYRTFRFHLGSLALGSFIIALVQLARYLLRKLEKKLKAKENKFVKMLFNILQCLLLCIERFLKFLNKNAYVEIAIYGQGFCKSAKWAFELIARNALRVIALNKVGGFLMFIGKVAITCLTGIAANTLIERYSESPTFWVTPMLVILFLAYGIAYCFMAVVDMAILTIFVSFCEDCERNDGSAEKPYYMVPKLMKYIDKEKQKKSDLAK